MNRQGSYQTLIDFRFSHHNEGQTSFSPGVHHQQQQQQKHTSVHFRYILSFTLIDYIVIEDHRHLIVATLIEHTAQHVHANTQN